MKTTCTTLSPHTLLMGRMIGVAVWIFAQTGLVAMLDAAEASAPLPPSGIYVNKDHDCGRVEFLQEGKCFLKVCSGYYSGTYLWEGNVCVCRPESEDEEPVILTREGDSFVDEEGHHWVPHDSVVKVPWPDMKPVTIVIVDSKTKKPVRDFSYDYAVSTPKARYEPLPARRTEVRAKDGSFSIDAPDSCEIFLDLEGPDLVDGYGSDRTIQVKSGDRKRKFKVDVRVGVTVTGVVVDAGSGKPIEGAAVAPTIFMSPAFRPARRHAVKTDKSGRFCVRSVDPSLGIMAWHQDYLESGDRECRADENEKAWSTREVRVELRAGDLLTGRVRDEDGRPLEGVTVSDGTKREVRTAVDGTFSMSSSAGRGGNRDIFRVSFDKDEYVRQTFESKTIPHGGIDIVLVRCPVLTGRVLDEDSKPVTNYRILAGPGTAPETWACTSWRRHGSNGVFRLTVNTGLDFLDTGKVWVGVSSPSHALWDTVLDVWKGSTSLTVRLDAGVSVVGRVTGGVSSKSEVSVQLTPCAAEGEGDGQDSELTARQLAGTMTVTADGKGAFRFEHVKEGAYTLIVRAEGSSPRKVSVTVPGSGSDVGDIVLEGCGTIAGRVYMPAWSVAADGAAGKVWAFAEGEVSYEGAAEVDGDLYDDTLHLKPISFKADENGRFRVEGVPVGLVWMSIPYHLSSDVMDAHVRLAQIVEGQNTEVRFFDPTGAWNVPFEFKIGDGSKTQVASGTGVGASRKVENVTTRPSMFIVQLQPLGSNPVSFAAADWEELDKKNRIVVRDVHPGRYHVRVGDWFGSTGFDEGALFEQDIEVPPTSKVVRVALGAGAITGEIRSPGTDPGWVHVMAVGSKQGNHLYHARCDDNGNFCLRYLRADTYRVMAHDDEAGWSNLGEVVVKDNVTDVGKKLLEAGATLSGKITFPVEEASCAGLVAKDSFGMEVEAERSGETYVIPCLWPGQWTVSFRRGSKIIAEAHTSITSTNAVNLDLARSK